jgi:hypothetical protein
VAPAEPDATLGARKGTAARGATRERGGEWQRGRMHTMRTCTHVHALTSPDPAA